jgi:sulfite oxidase
MSDRIVHSADPLNAEPALSVLRARWLTEQGDFYVRSHGTVPLLEAGQHRVRVHGRVAQTLELSVEALRTGFAQRSVTAAMQCAGNRRSDLLAVRAVEGDPWRAGAIGNAEWTGVALRDVLRAAGAAEGASHVAFGAVDEMTKGGATFRYGVSIPLGKALSPEVLLAWGMNGAPLAAEHGFPLRVVVPGFAGVRSAKWVAEIEVRDSPADTPVQLVDYRLFPGSVGEGEADPALGMTIDAMPLNSAICEPARDALVAAGPVRVSGYAVSTDRSVSRVEVSADGGRSWCQARVEEAASPWSWVFWGATVELPAGEHELAVRAWDSAGQTQPASAEEVWNYKGYLCNAWHRVRVSVR